LGEAKNLPPYPGPNKMRDCYCTVNLDQEEVFRTKIIEKSLCPFYGEDFYCEIPRSFRHLSFYIFDRDVFRRDSIIGKVAVKKEDLQKYHGRDTWFQFQHVDADSEVQGKVHLELRLSEVITDSGVVCHKLAARVIECHGLPIVNGQCDPYATVTLLGPSRSEAKKTKVKRKTNNPQFDEVFYFEVTRPLSYTRRSHFDIEEEDVDKMAVRIDLWNASNLKFGDEFLGEIKIPLTVLGQSSVHEAWYFLQPRDNGSKSIKPDDLGSLRLNIVYTEDHVFPAEYYCPLRDLLLKSADVEPVSASAAHVLGEVCREKQEAAIPLVRLFLHYGKIVPFLSAIANAEVNRTLDPNTIFRGNSLTSKCIDETMKLAGMHYLQVTLKPIIDEICGDHKPCEIDPVKLKDAENLDNNRLLAPGNGVDHDVRYTAVSSFIFLRFFAPAILSPNLFHLRPHHPDPQTSRTLTLISKTIQTLGSLAKSKSASFKESYMASFYDFFNEHKYADAVKNFLDLISSSGRRDHKRIETPIMLKEGFMIKRAQGRKRFGRKNFKKRWFRLTNHEFTYHKNKVDHPLCNIPIENILAVEKLEEESFKMKNMFQVIQPERALYIQANNCVEAKDWIDILTKVSQCNNKRLSTYHPSAYLNGHWLCCKASSDSAAGCSPCTGGLPANIQLNVDGDRETERIYSLFSTYMSKLDKMQEACGSKSVYDGPEQEEYSGFVIDDPQETYKTLKLLAANVHTLEQEHAQYKKTKYGSHRGSYSCYYNGTRCMKLAKDIKSYEPIPVCIPLKTARNSEVLYLGEQFVALPVVYLRFRLPEITKFAAEFDLRTFDPEGVILYAESPQNSSWFMVGLRHGKIEIQYKNEHSVKITSGGKAINNGQWHCISVDELEKSISVKIAKEAVMSISSPESLFHPIDGVLETKLYIAGLPRPVDSLVKSINPRLDGCIRAWNLMNQGGSGVKGVIQEKENKHCLVEVERGSYFPGSGMAHFRIDYKSIDGKNWTLSLKLNIRPSTSTGVIFALASGETVPLSVAVVDSDSPNEQEIAVFIENVKVTRLKSVRLCYPGHLEVELEMSSSEVQIKANSFRAVHYIQPPKMEKQLSILDAAMEGQVDTYVGGIPDVPVSATPVSAFYNGCIEIEVNGKGLDFDEAVLKHNDIKSHSCPPL
ncbi:Ras GTPase-activating protein 3, partial [Acipenser ruthenus]